MNARTSAVRLAIACAALSLAACAAHDTRHAAQPRHARAGLIDHERMAEVNHVARSKGVEVVWVNPPYRSRDD